MDGYIRTRSFLGYFIYVCVVSVHLNEASVQPGRQQAFLHTDNAGICKASNLSPKDDALGEETKRRTVAVPGEPWMWKRIAEHFIDRSPIKLLVLGGSVETRPWVKNLCDWLSQAVSGSSCINGAVGATGSKYHAENLQVSGSSGQDIQELRPDVILLDTSVNPWAQMKSEDGFLDTRKEGMYVEDIIRKVLSLDFKPLLVAMEWMTFMDSVATAPYFLTNEDHHVHVYRYYGVPVCSIRDALWPHLALDSDQTGGEGQVSRAAPELTIDKISDDLMHPSDLGGKLMVDLFTDCLCRNIERTAATLKSGNIKNISTRDPAAIPTKLHTKDLLARIEGNFTGAITPESVGFGKSLGNATQHVKDVIMLLSCGTAIAWEALAGTASPAAPHSSMRVLMPGLSLVRLVAAMHIAIMHFYQLQPEYILNTLTGNLWTFWGKHWVQFFFILSGFVLYLSENKGHSDEGSTQTTWVDHLRFVRRRLQSLLPTFLFGMVLAVLSTAGQATIRTDPIQLVYTLLLVQSWISPYGAATLNGPSWYLSTLLAFYIAYPRWVRQVQHVRSPWAMLFFMWSISILLSSAAVVLCLLQNQSAQTLLQSGVMAFLEFHPLCNWHLFMSGLLLARLFCDNHKEWSEMKVTRVGASLTLLLIMLVFAFVPPPNKVLEIFFSKGPILLPVFGFLIVNFAAGQDIVLQWKFLEHAFFVDWVSGWSWCLYIIHVPFFFLWQFRLEMTFQITHPLTILAISMTFTAVVNTLFDRPIRAVTKKACL